MPSSSLMVPKRVTKSLRKCSRSMSTWAFTRSKDLLRRLLWCRRMGEAAELFSITCAAASGAVSPLQSVKSADPSAILQRTCRISCQEGLRLVMTSSCYSWSRQHTESRLEAYMSLGITPQAECRMPAVHDQNQTAALSPACSMHGHVKRQSIII